jgi:alpha-glucosidase
VLSTAADVQRVLHQDIRETRALLFEWNFGFFYTGTSARRRGENDLCEPHCRAMAGTTAHLTASQTRKDVPMPRSPHATRTLTALAVSLSCAAFAQADAAVEVSPCPLVAGTTVEVAYDPAGRVLDGAPQVFMHYGFNSWEWVVGSDPAMMWDPAEGVWRGSVEVPANAGLLDLAFQNGADEWDNHGGADWHFFVARLAEETWDVDGILDDDAILIAQSNGMSLYAGLRGSILYLAAPAAADGLDHFLLLADTPGVPRSAPWAKFGTVAGWSAFIGNEESSGWVGWFDASGATEVAAATWIEGTIDLTAEFGAVPSQVYLAFAPYLTPDGGELEPLFQVPASNNFDFDVDADEYIAVDLAAIQIGGVSGDLDFDGDFDADDYALWAACFAGPGVPTCAVADLDDDGDGDLLDFARLQQSTGNALAYLPVAADDLGPRVTRFLPEDVDIASLPPSMSLAIEPTVEGPAAEPWVIQPQFFDTADRHAVLIDIPEGTSLYGTGEVCGGLLRNGFSTEAWNTDAYGYGPRNQSLYQSHPWVLAVREDGTAFGVLADTTFRCRMDLNEDILFAAEGPPFPIYVFEGDTPQDVLIRLTDFIGRMDLPPLWTLGYQQSYFSYAPEQEARRVAQMFRTSDIPCDVIWFDIDYMDGFRIFTFDPSGFPDPLALNTELHADGFHTVWMIDPGAKVEGGYFVYDQGSAGDHWVYDAQGSWYTGEVWPGDCHFPDYTRPETQTWWASLYQAFMANGVDGVWNDINEPGIFDGPNHSMPVDCWHRGGGGLPAGPHAQYHNVYGMLMARSSREGILAANPELRPFVLSRANFIGGHRYAAMWTGDNVATWEHLGHSTPMMLNMGLSGQPFAGPDIGGFAGDNSAELFARWMGLGVFMPFCRTHSDNQGVVKEPWAYGPDTEDACRVAIQRRYRLLPYLYTLFREAAETGLPVGRPVFFADPSDLSLRDEDVAFLLGADLLVVPNLEYDPQSAPEPAIPTGTWRTVQIVGEDSTNDVNQPDLRVRDGAILPLGPVEEYTGELALSPLTLIISLDGQGYAEGWLYEDDGNGFDHLAGDYRRAFYTATQVGNQVIVEVADREGSMPTPSRIVQIEILTEGGVVQGAGMDADAGVIASITLP